MASERAEARTLAARLNIGVEAARMRLRRERAEGQSWDVTEDQRMLGTCEVCGDSPVVKDRLLGGWLCRKHATALGMVDADPRILQALQDYITQHVQE
jgi:hypothetical protein